MNAQQYEESFLLAEKLITQDPPDFARAIPLLCEAAEAGHIEAAFQLAGCLIEHHENAQDLAIAVSYLKQAAQAGHPYARYNLLQIEESRGIPIEDLVGAYQELAEEGLAPAQLRLMRLYADNGNDQEAVKWALKAAEQQNPQAQYFLAQYYHIPALLIWNIPINFISNPLHRGLLRHTGNSAFNTNWDKVLHKTLKKQSNICVLPPITTLFQRKLLLQNS